MNERLMAVMVGVYLLSEAHPRNISHEEFREVITVEHPSGHYGFDRKRARIVFTPTPGNFTVTLRSAPAPCQARTSPMPNDGWRSLAPTCRPGPDASSVSYSTTSSPGLPRGAGAPPKPDGRAAGARGRPGGRCANSSRCW